MLTLPLPGSTESPAQQAEPESAGCPGGPGRSADQGGPAVVSSGRVPVHSQRGRADREVEGASTVPLHTKYSEMRGDGAIIMIIRGIPAEDSGVIKEPKASEGVGGVNGLEVPVGLEGGWGRGTRERGKPGD